MEYTQHEQAVFAVLRTVLWGTERFPAQFGEGVDWASVYQELSDHALGTLAVDAAQMIPELDIQLKQTWMRKAMRSMAFWQKLMKEQEALKVLFQGEQIPFVVLKGAAAAVYYPQPDRRAMGDVDLIVLPEDFDRACQVMLDGGYELVSDQNERHFEYKKNGILFELHRYFAVMSDQEAAQWFDGRIYDGIRLARQEALETYTVPMLPSLENGLVLLMHINQHLETGLGLRQIVDWMMFVERELDDAWWDREFADHAERLGLKTLAVTVTRMCQMHLGLREEEVRWCAAADEALCDELMRFTLDRGNFGRKTNQEGASVPILNAMSQLTNIPKLLQKHGCINWKALQKYPFLKPFAWLYQLCRYIRKGLEREHPFRTLWHDMRKAHSQDDLLTRLGVTNRLKKKFEQ